MLPEATAVAQTTDPPPPAVTTCSGGMAGTYPCSNVDLMAFLALADMGGGSGNDIWGWTDSSTGKEYAIMGRTNGTSFVDISDPVNPIYLGDLPPHSANSTWRDIKVYADHAFIVTEADNSGMQVFDLTQLREVASPPATFSETAHYSGFGDAHNLAINEDSGFAYAVGTNNCSGGLHMLNIQTPTNPTSAGCFSADGYTHDAQCVNYDGPDLDHQGKEICFNSNEDTLTIVDVTNKADPVMLSRTGYSGSRYTHQGWLTEDQGYFLLGDESDETHNPDVTNTRTYMWDVSDLDDPALIGSHDSTTTATDHNQYVKGSYTYQSNYRAGLRILDITDIANGNLSEEAFFDIYPGSDSRFFNGAWSNYPFFDSGMVIVSGEEQGLFVLRPNLVTASVSGVRATNITQTGATVTVTIANPGSSQKTVYLRYRTTPNGAWSATQEDRGSAASRTFALSELAAETEYEVEASRDSRFPADSRVSATFTSLADTTAPTVLLITSDATHPTKDLFTVTITFSEAVTGLTAGEIAVTNGAGSSFAGTGASYTLDIEPSPDIEGNVTVRVPANAAVDGANLGNVEGSETFAVDTRAPTVETVKITSNAGSDSTYAAEETIEVTVTFDETVVVARTPQLTLTVGRQTKPATYDRGSNTDTLVFAYPVADSDLDTGGVSIAAGRIDRNGGTIKDGSENEAVLDHEAVGPQAGHKVDGIKPVLLSAAVNEAALTLTYSEVLDGGSRPAAGDFTVAGGDSARTVSNVAVSGSTVELTLDPEAEHGEAGITMSYTPGTNPTRDTVGNKAEALSYESVTNDTPDTTSPTVSSVEITSTPPDNRDTYAIGDVIEAMVTFDETVVVTGRPRLSLTVGPQTELGVPTTFELAIYDRGSNSETLVFAYKVVEGDTDDNGVSIDANRLSLNGGTIQDGADNNAVLDHEAVGPQAGHKVDGGKPELAATDGAVADGTTLTLTYNEPLDGSSSPETGDFTVAGGDVARTVSRVVVTGRAVELVLDPGAEHEEAGITVSYTPWAQPLRDAVGNDALGLSNEPVRNDTPDTTAPTIDGIKINSNPPDNRDTYAIGNVIEATVTFDEAVVVSRTPRLTLKVAGGDRTANYRRGTGAALVFSYSVVEGDSDTDGVSIDANRLSLNGGTIQDGADNNAVLDHEAVGPQAGHKVDGVKPEFQSASVNEAALTLTYGEALDGSSSPETGDFTVEVGGSGRSVSAVSVSGSAVTLTLNEAVEHGDTGIRVSYSPGTRPIQDAVGNDALGLNNELVTNTTGAPNTAPEITSRGPFEVRENQARVTRLAARDADAGDEVTGWAIMGGADRSQFTVASDTGELSFREAPNYEVFTDVASSDPPSVAGDNEYIVVVRVTSGAGDRELRTEQAIAVRVADEREPPDVPEAPTFSGETANSLRVSWREPDNSGPPITDYDVQYHTGSDAYREWTHEGPGRTATITGLDVGTAYQVQVRASNEEGMSDWSEPGEGMTIAPLTVQMTLDPEPPVEGAFKVRFSFSETVTGFTLGDIVAQQDADCRNENNDQVACNPPLTINGPNFEPLQTTDNQIFTITVTPQT